MSGSPSDAPGPSGAPLSEADAAGRVGHFLLASRLGAGGMGEVWKAWDEPLSRWVALKFLKGSDDDEVQRFQREAQTAARLSHPNIAAVYEVGTHSPGDGPARHWIAMQYVEGRTLKGYPRQDLPAVVRLIRDAARAIHAAHEQGIVHRDLKPENLMIDAAGRLYVMDFGLARQTTVNSSLSRSGFAVGTPAYMPPEQARGQSGTADARSDVYSLGATLYELLSGREPFEGGDIYELLMKVIDADPAPLRSLNPRVDADLDTVVHKCLEKSPARRYPSAAALADDLDRWLSGEPILARPVSTAERLVRRIRRHKAVSASLAAVVLVVLAGTVLLLVQSRRARQEIARSEELRRRNEQQLKELSLLWAGLLEKKRDLRSLTVPARDGRKGLEAAVDAVVAFTERNPELPQGWYLKARGQVYLGRSREAMAAADRAVELAPDFGPAHALRGIIRTYDVLETAVAWSDRSWVRSGERRLALLRDATAAFARAEQDGLGPEHAVRWGLAPSVEDDDLRILVEALLQRAEDRIDSASRILDARLLQRRSEEVLLWRGLITPGAEGVQFLSRAVDAAPGYADAWFYRGTLRREEDPSGALADFDKALELQPGLVFALVNRSNVRRQLGDLDGAVADALAATSHDPAFSLAWFNLAAARRERGDLEVAEAGYSEALRLEPGLFEAWTNRANVRRDKGDPDGAMRDYEQALRLRPGLPMALSGRAQTRFGTGDVEGALEDYAEAIRQDPGFAPSHYARALLYLELGDLDAALRDARRGVELDGRSPAALLARGTILHRRGDYAGAIRDYDAVLQLDGTCADAWNNRSDAHAQLGRLEEALTDSNEALRLDPRHAGAWANRGNARLLGGDAAGAKRDYDEAIRLDPSRGSAFDGRGVALQRLGDSEAALRDFAEAVRLMPRNHLPLLHRAELRRDRKDYEGALSDLEAAAARQPRDATVFIIRASVQVSLRDYEAATRDCDEAIRLDPRRGEPYFLRGQIRANHGDLDGGISDFERVIELMPGGSRLHEIAHQLLADTRARRKP